VVTEQKTAPTKVVSKPVPTARVVGRISLQFPSASTETKLTSCQGGGISCKPKQIPREPKTAQSMQIWTAKPRASPREALGEVEDQPRLSHEEKGKMPLSVDGIAYAASTWGTQSPFSREAKLEDEKALDVKPL